VPGRGDAPRVRLEPTDLLSDVAGTVPRIVVSPGGAHSIDERLVRAVAATVRLETWPEGEPVVVEFVAKAERRPEGPLDRWIVAPEAGIQLDDRWYALRAGPLPQGLEWPVVLDAVRLPGGLSMTRFRPGTDPVVRAVRMCSGQDGSNYLIVDVSERVKALSSGAAGVHVAGAGGEACRVMDELLAEDGGLDSLYIQCAGSAPSGERVLTVAPGLFQSAQGAALRSATQPTMTYAVSASLPSWGEHCLRLTP
jgi:hypothetical protein